MSWQAGSLAVLTLVLIAGLLWYERSRPPARIVAAVATLAALAVAGRVALAPIPNVVATTDVVLLAGFTLGPAPGFAVGALAALVSNFWLGQGPWTPWQMGAWGLVGIGGATLAVLTGRRVGRFGLAAAAALAGLAYGAILDLHTMVSYGGEQSLERYVALSARGIPFNLAHAAGNAALMLAAGPAIVRMLDRYRTRFEVRWRPLVASRGAALLLGLLVATGSMWAIAAGPPSAQAASPADAARWLAGAQNRDGGFGHAAGAGSSPAMTGWALLGLRSAGRHPSDVRRGGRSGLAYLRRNAGALRSTGDLERTILVVGAAGGDPRSFGGRDLIAELLSRQRRDGSWEAQVNLTAFGALALRSARAGRLGPIAAWLRRAQNDDGGWGSTPGGQSEPDSTGAALQALAVSPGGRGAIADGVRWLRRAQRPDGGFSLTPGAQSNSQSTAWAVQGMVGAGTNPARVRRRGRSPLDFLAARQRSDGRYSYSRTSDQTPVWVTAQALNAVNGDAFPLAAARRAASRGRAPGGGEAGGDPGRVRGAGGPGAGADVVRSGRGRDVSDGRRAGERGRGRGGTAGPGREARADQAAASDPVAETPAPDSDEGASTPAARSRLPSTPILLGGLGALAAVLAGGGLLYRRRLG